MNTKPKKISSVDIARIAGVSQATVSRVLSGADSVKASTREKILAVIDAHGYRPNVFAQGMRTNHSSTVGVAVSRITNPIVPELLEELSRQFNLKNRRVIVWNTDESGQESLIEAVGSGLVDGVVFTAASHQSQAVQAALDVGLPIVSINRAAEGVSCDQVVSNNEESGTRVAQYLANSGKKQLAFVNGPLDRTTLLDRERGFRQQLDKAGLALRPDFYFQSDFKDDTFRQFGMDIGTMCDRPDAIACGNDLIAIHVLNGLKAVGLRVPEDIWVVGFDGIQMAAWDIIDLTTMSQPVELMAQQAAKLLIARIAGEQVQTETRQFHAELVIRGSTNNHRI
jgi:LacI family transcriptional regulator